MTSRTKITELTAGSQTEGGVIPIVQSGATVKQTIGTAAVRDAGTASGDVPVLGSNGALPANLGGTGLIINDDASSPSQYFGRNASGVVGLHPLSGGGGGGGSVAFATEAQFLTGTSTDRSLNPAIVADWREGVDRRLLDDWGPWATATTATFSTLPVDGGSVAGHGVYNLNTRDATSENIPNGELRIFGPLCLNIPTPSAGTFVWALATIDGDSNRWLIVNTSTNAHEVYRLEGDSSWANITTTGTGIFPAVYALPNNNRWYPVSTNSAGGPSGSVPYFAKRDGGEIDAAWIARPSDYNFSDTSREYQIDIQNGGVTTAALGTGVVTNDKLAGSISITKLDIAGTPATGRVIQMTSATAAQYVDLASAVIADQSITYEKISPAAIASEEDVFGSPTVNDHLIANKTLFDAFENRDREMGIFWKDWTAVTETNRTDVGATGVWNVAYTGGIQMRNTAAFNARTSQLNANQLYMVGTNVTGAPTLSSGTLRGGWLFVDSNSRRWYFPIDNPESPDSEEFFYDNGTGWTAVAYNSDLLDTHYHSLDDGGAWVPFASHARGGPPASEFQLNADIARRSGNDVVVLTAVYDTNNNEFRVFTVQQKFEIPVSDASVGPAAIDSTNAGVDGQILIKAGSRFTYVDNTGGVQDGSVTFAKLNASILASEADIFDDPTADSKLVGNKRLYDVLQEFEDALGASWDNWTTETGINLLTTITNAGLSVPGTSGVVMKNASTFSLKTGDDGLSNGNLLICGTDCVDEPTLTSGTARAFLLFLDSAGTRWAMPVDNPESSDDEEFFRLSGSDWTAVGYKGDELRVHLHALRDDSRWNPMAAHSIGGPGSAINAFNDETAIARRKGGTIELLRMTYSTATPVGFTISVANQDLDVGGAGLTFTTENLFNVTHGNRITNTNTNNLDSGKSFADWDMISFVMGTSGFSNSQNYKYYSQLFPADSVGSQDELLNVGDLNIDLISNTTWKISAASSNWGVMQIRGHKYS